MDVHRRRFFALLGSSCTAAATAAPAPAQACMWDTDTLEQEIRGAPEVFQTLIGGFAQNPPKYYEMRLERVRGVLEADPDDLAAYDDAAVASDRLGRHDDAIAFMAGKRAALERLGLTRQDARASEPGEPNHWYRYHANLGTFHAHRWLGQANRWDDIAELERAHELIAAALEDNPDAHFGREVYQLRILAWLRTRPTMPTGSEAELPSFMDFEAETGDEVIAGLCGLITLGAAWNSLDVTFALMLALLAERKITLAALAGRRCGEIVEAGGGSLVIGAPVGKDLLGRLPAIRGAHPRWSLELDPLREEVEEWSARREAYLLERLERGEHPDTHPLFWSAFVGDPHRIRWRSDASASGAHAEGSRAWPVGETAFGAVLGLAALWFVVRRVRVTKDSMPSGSGRGPIG